MNKPYGSKPFGKLPSRLPRTRRSKFMRHGWLPPADRKSGRKRARREAKNAIRNLTHQTMANQ